MRIEYLKLENIAGIKVGSNRDYIEIDFKNSKNKIVSIEGHNGNGKTVLLSSLTPFSSVSSALDDRGSLSYILQGKNGYKEIHYTINKDYYIIKHYFKSTKETHSIKSYFSLNGNELNENGNVTSFLSLVEQHFGLTQDMMRLIRLGSNVHSFISLTPARRKESIGKLIKDLDLYMAIYKKITDDLKVVKVLLSSNQSNLYNCHISDLVIEEEKLIELNNKLQLYEKDRDVIVSKISKIQSLENENNIEELKQKRQEAELSLMDFEKTLSSIQDKNLFNVNLDDLINKRTSLQNDRINIQSKINSYRISIDNVLKQIERLQTSIKKITSDNDIQSLINAIENLKNILQSTDKVIINFRQRNCTSEDVHNIIAKLSSFNQISQMFYTFGNLPIEIYLKLRHEKKSVDDFLKKQIKKNLTRVSDNDLKRLFSQVFQDDEIVMPNCIDFKSCPYYRISDMIQDFKNTLNQEVFDDETLNYIKVISNNIDNILNEVDKLRIIDIPETLKEVFREKIILEKLHDKQLIFDISNLQEYLSILRGWEIYNQNTEKLQQYEQQLSIYKNSGIDSQLLEIKELENNINFYHNNIDTLEKDLINITDNLKEIETNIVLVTKYNDVKKYENIIKSTLQNIQTILLPLESATSEKIELRYKLNSIEENINNSKADYKQLDHKISEYKRLVSEQTWLEKEYLNLDQIQKAVSTRKGLPVKYIKKYLKKIQKMANDLLEIIYNGKIRLSKIEIDQDVFEIPYIVNGTKIPDVKHGSQSEVDLMTIALSFALMHRLTGNYNIILLDEIDSGLDEDNRSLFLKMLNHQMLLLKAEQTFIISQNINQMANLPMDVIRLSDTGFNFKNQNIIYE